jgi:hypothetical protein
MHQTLSFKEINAVMDDSHIQYYVSSLHDCIKAGKVVLLDADSKVLTILRKQEFPSSIFLTIWVNCLD